MCLLLGLVALGVDWESFDEQEQREVFMGLTAPPQWVRVEEASVVRAVEVLQRNGYLRIGWYHGSKVYKLTSKGIEVAAQIMAETSLAALDQGSLMRSADRSRKCSWHETYSTERSGRPESA